MGENQYIINIPGLNMYFIPQHMFRNWTNQIKYITEWGQDGRVRKTLNFCLSKEIPKLQPLSEKTIKENSLKAIRKDFSQLK